MNSFKALLVILIAAVSPLAGQHRGHGGGHRSSSSGRERAPRASSGERDSRGRIHRSAQAKDDFMRESGHPHGWPGHVVDHVVPLACGGADDPSNMQWQTVKEGKAKDKVERQGCGSSRPR